MTTTNITTTSSSNQLLLILTFTLSLLLRFLIAFHSHSGQNNYHGSAIAYGGDFEAQRHWMEITFHLPISKWYIYDTQYWGLDYPPLTAYGSYVLGWLSHVLVGSDSVALDSSRGYEDVIHKGFMRATVIGLDCILYFPIVYWIMKRLIGCCSSKYGDDYDNSNKSRKTNLEGWLFGVLIQPALLIIDHGHFQYNAVCLALALGSFHYMTDMKIAKNIQNYYGIDRNCIIGSILFCLALNWKQMALYYAPAVFAYLLGRCFAYNKTTSYETTTTESKQSKAAMSNNRSGIVNTMKNALIQIGMLGITVLSTFGILWIPFYIYRDATKDESIIDVFVILLKRIFPFSRGLFEGKVGNLWCAASVKPFSIRERIPSSIQPLCALALTFLMIMPFCVILFQVGRMNNSTSKSSSSSITLNTNHEMKMVKDLHLKALLWGATGTSLSFFLASFQVHEKSILLPLAPLSLLAFDKPTIVFWFSFVALWSMWHLIVVDRLQVAYFSLTVLFMSYVAILRKTGIDKAYDHSTIKTSTTQRLVLFVVQLSSTGMILLHLLEAIITPPSNLPDLFPVLWVIGSCLSFCFMWLMALLEIFYLYFNPYQDSFIQDKKLH